MVAARYLITACADVVVAVVAVAVADVVWLLLLLLLLVDVGGAVQLLLQQP